MPRFLDQLFFRGPSDRGLRDRKVPKSRKGALKDHWRAFLTQADSKRGVKVRGNARHRHALRMRTREKALGAIHLGRISLLPCSLVALRTQSPGSRWWASLNGSRRAAMILALWLGGSSCGHWNGESEYHPPVGRTKAGAVSFGIGLPGKDWKPYPEKESGVQVAWLSQKSSSVIQVRSQCAEHGDSSLEMFTAHIGADFGNWQVRELDTGEKDRRGRPITEPVQKNFRLAGRTAMRSTVDAELDGVPISLEVVVLKKDGCLFDLTLISPPNAFDSEMPAFDRVVKGFRFPLRGRS